MTPGDQQRVWARARSSWCGRLARRVVLASRTSRSARTLRQARRAVAAASTSTLVRAGGCLLATALLTHVALLAVLPRGTVSAVPRATLVAAALVALTAAALAPRVADAWPRSVARRWARTVLARPAAARSSANPRQPD